MPVTQPAHFSQEAAVFTLEHKRLKDHASGLIADGAFQRGDVVVVKGKGEILRIGGDAGAAVGDGDIPVMPAMVAAAQHLLPTCEGTG